MSLRLVLAEKSELNLNEKDAFSQIFHRGISNKPRSFILCEKKPAKAQLKLFTQPHWSQSHTIVDFSNLRMHCYRFTPAAFHKYETFVSPFSAVTVSLHHLPAMSEVNSHIRNKDRGARRNFLRRG